MSTSQHYETPLDEYIELLQTHDWYFEYSDDHKVWARGQKQQQRLSFLRQQLDPDGLIFKQYQR